MDDSNPPSEEQDDLQKELDLPRAHSNGDTEEGLVKQVGELRARLEDHQARTALNHATIWEEHVYLKKLLAATLAALVLLNVATLPFFGKQMRIIQRQLPKQREATRSMNSALMRSEPVLKQVASQLEAFGAANPDYQVILDRYKRRLPQYFTDMAAPAGQPTDVPRPPTPATQ